MMQEVRPISWQSSYGRAVELARTLERENAKLREERGKFDAAHDWDGAMGENAKLRADEARIDWLKADPYVRLTKLRTWLPISYVPPAPDIMRAAFDNAMKA